MAQIRIVDPQNPSLPPPSIEETMAMLQSGWTCLPNVKVEVPEGRKPQGVQLIDGKSKALAMVDIWVGPNAGSVIPAGILADVIATGAENEEIKTSGQALDFVSKEIFNMDLGAVLAKVTDYRQQKDAKDASEN